MLRRVDALLTVPQGREAPDPQEVRQRAFAALRELLARLADRKPVVVCIDDLQWGDADSAALLTELVRPPDAPCFLFVGCHRREENASPFLTALAESNRLIWSEVDRRQVSLDALSTAEAEELATRLLNSAEAAQGCAAAIARESGGNPFFVYELVRYLAAERGCSFTEGAIDLGEVLWRRIEQLPAQTRELLAVVALAARPLPQDAACHAAGLAQGRMEELTLLRSQRLARGTGMSGDDLLVTYHDRIREAFHTHLSAEHTQHLHGRLAESLEAWGHADAEWLATHWEYAGQRRRASEYYGRAADQAAETLAFENAADLYRRALQMGSDDAQVRRQLQRKLGDALANAGRGAEAAKIYLAAAEEETAAETLELQRRAAEQLLRSGRIDEGLTVLEDVLGRVGLKLPKRKWQAILGLLFQRSLLWLRGVRFHQRQPSEISPRDINRIDVCWTTTVGLSLVDPFSASLFQTHHLLLALRAGDTYRVARGLAIEVGYSALAGGRTRWRGEKLLLSAMTLAEQINHPHALGLVNLWRGCAAWLVGEWEKTRESCDCAEGIFREQCVGVAWELASTHTFLFAALVWLGELKDHALRFPALLQEAQKRGDQFAISTLPLLTYAYITSLAADKPDLARRELRQAMEGWSRHGYHLQHFWAFYGELETDIYCGETLRAWCNLQDQWPSITRSLLLRVQTIRLFALHLRARITLALACSDQDRSGSHIDARQRLNRIVADIQRIEREKMRWGDGLAHLLRAGMAGYQGDRVNGERFLSEAITCLESVNMNLYAAAARRRLGQLIGGDQGRSLMAEADAWMTAQGIRNPARMTAVYAPGFADP